MGTGASAEVEQGPDDALWVLEDRSGGRLLKLTPGGIKQHAVYDCFRCRPMVQIHPTARLRASPFYECTLAEGMSSASVYNSMILPTSYGDPEAEYWRIIEGVSQWDVAVQRQVQLTGTGCRPAGANSRRA